jgi:hypothetical protein
VNVVVLAGTVSAEPVRRRMPSGDDVRWIPGVDRLERRPKLEAMIPTLLIVGLVLGRWWRVVIPAATLGWAVLLVATGVGSGLGFVFSASLIAIANVTLGVLVYQAARLLVHRVAGNHG